MLDFERLIAGIRWQRRTWMSFALLGLFAGVLLTALFPPPPTAVTRVLIVHAKDQQGERSSLMETDVALCQTTEIARAALKEINVPQRPGDFLATYRCAGVTPDILEITVSGTSGSDAVRRAQALADVFIANHFKR
ncbi:MAG: Wzz/FepE/Etk N-terminal domain-containing protein, partial [Pseudonocardiaceae bacterium]